MKINRRRLFGVMAACFLAVGNVGGAPMATSDLELMLRGGFSNEEIASEVRTKQMREPLTPEDKARLRKLGATDALFIACMSSVMDANSVARALDEQKARDAQTEVGRKSQAEQIKNAPKKEAAESAMTPFAAGWQGDLITVKNGAVQPFDGSLVGKKYLAIYFSASWCGPCRKFTPALLQVYTEMRKRSQDFEVILVSSDKSEKSMIAYMTEDKMQWPAVRFDKINESHPLRKYAGNGIPNLVLLDAEGKVLAASYQGDKYIGPMVVLKALAAREGFRFE